MSMTEADDYTHDPLLDDKEAAALLKTTSTNMKQSRHSGTLFGRPAPKFIKMGKKCVYRRSRLLQFIAQFDEFQCTAEYANRPAAARA